MIIRDIPTVQCTALVSANRLARLACSHADHPYLVSISYAYSESCAYAFTMPGRKLETMRINPNAALLVEDKGEGRNWRSVMAEGRFEELPDRIGFKRQRDHAWSLLSQHAAWWEPGALKPVTPPLSDHSEHVFFRIRIEHMSGREAIEE